jgi:hypothetical protein
VCVGVCSQAQKKSRVADFLRFSASHDEKN